MAKKITYKVETYIDPKALEELLNEYASKGWILHLMTQCADESYTVVFRDK